jgi:hypothetical protein
MGVSYGFFDNFKEPAILFFFLGWLASLIKSDLAIPSQISKFLGIYLLMAIGIKGGAELNLVGVTHTSTVVLLVCILMSFTIPFIVYKILRFKLSYANSAVIAASYGSTSAVTFITASAFLEQRHIHFDAFMVTCLAIMETPAIISGLILAKYNELKHEHSISLMSSIQEGITNGSVVVLLGSLFIGYFSGYNGSHELQPFVGDIFRGMLCLYMLDMGIIAGSEIGLLARSGIFLTLFALLFSPLVGLTCIMIASIMQLSAGDSLLFCLLGASASYIAVPAAMRFSVPQANLSLLLPMALGVTFSFNITIGIPLYNMIIQHHFIRLF